MSDRIAALLYRWRVPVSIFVLAGAVLLAPLANITAIDNDISAWFSKDDPVYQDYERFRQEFGGTRTLIVALEGDRLFEPASLERLRRITEDIERIPTVLRVQSLTTANLVDGRRAPGDEGSEESLLEVRPLVPDGGAIDAARVRADALGDPLLAGDLVSTDGRVTAIIVSFDEARIDDVRAGVIERIHGVVDPQLPPGVTAHYNGSLEISETYNRITLANQRNFMPPIMGLTLLAIYAMFRSVRKTVVSAVAIGASVLWTLGLYSLMGFSYNVLSSMLVPLIVVLAIADDVHIVQHFDWALREHGGDRELAFKSSVAHLLKPLFGAGGTTALGMLSLATSDVLAVRAFGLGAAVGIMVDLLISITLVPTLLAWVRPEPRISPQERFLLEPLARVAAFSTRAAWPVLGLAAIVTVAASLGILRLRVDTNHVNFFSDAHPINRSARVIDRQLSGIYSFQIMLEGPAETMKEPATLRRMERLQRELAGLAYVRKVTSIVDYVKRVNEELREGQPAFRRIPDTRAEVAQELFVFGLAEEGRRELERLVSSDFAKAQISVKLASMSSDLVFQQIETAEALALEAFEGTDIVPTVTGAGRLFAALDHYLVVSQLSSFGTAFLTVFGVIFIVFRSVRFGALAIVPNLFPVVAMLGLMGWLGISLNVATVMLASVALGVVDDDTIHFINRYRKETHAGHDTDAAIRLATSHEGRASLTTVLINSAGFGVLMLSDYKPTAWFGGLLALTMLVAFLAEAFVLPATIKLVPSLFGAERLRGRALVPTAPAVR